MEATCLWYKLGTEEGCAHPIHLSSHYKQSSHTCIEPLQMKRKLLYSKCLLAAIQQYQSQAIAFVSDRTRSTNDVNALKKFGNLQVNTCRRLVLPPINATSESVGIEQRAHYTLSAVEGICFH